MPLAGRKLTSTDMYVRTKDFRERCNDGISRRLPLQTEYSNEPLMLGSDSTRGPVRSAVFKWRCFTVLVIIETKKVQISNKKIGAKKRIGINS